MVLLDLSLYPLGEAESIGSYVAKCVDIIDRSGLEYRCHAMGTTIEGEFDQVMAVVRDCFHALADDCHRVEGVIKFDYRKDSSNGFSAKVASVERNLGREVKK